MPEAESTTMSHQLLMQKVKVFHSINLAAVGTLKGRSRLLLLRIATDTTTDAKCESVSVNKSCCCWYPLRAFAPVATAHHYCACKITRHIMHKACALRNKTTNDREDGHCYSLAWI